MLLPCGTTGPAVLNSHVLNLIQPAKLNGFKRGATAVFLNVVQHGSSTTLGTGLSDIIFLVLLHVSSFGLRTFTSVCYSCVSYMYLLNRQERFTGKYTTHKILTKLYPGPEWRIFHILTSEDIDDVISCFSHLCKQPVKNGKR